MASKIFWLSSGNCTRSVGSSPHGLLHGATWVSSQFSGWILRAGGPRNRNWELPVFLKPQPQHRDRSLLPYSFGQSHTYSREGNIGIPFMKGLSKNLKAS